MLSSQRCSWRKRGPGKRCPRKGGPEKVEKVEEIEKEKESSKKVSAGTSAPGGTGPHSTSSSKDHRTWWPNGRDMVIVYLSIYFIVGTALHCNYYPWT